MKKYFQLRKYKLDHWKKNALVSQEIILFELLRKAQNTEFGQKYNFSDIRSFSEFQKKIPISSYDTLKVYIEKMLKGEEDILWPGKINCFSKSSGTTNDVSKFIPVSHDSLYQGNYKAGRDIYTLFFDNYPESDLFLGCGSVLGLGGSFEVNGYGVMVGDVSAIIMSELPPWAEKYREPSMDIALMSDWKKKIPAIIGDTCNKNITHISGVPTWFVSLFDEMRKDSHYQTLRDIWPNLELFIHGAVSFAPYRSIFEKLLPYKDMKYMEVYNASEGFFAIQDDPDRPGEMLLLTDHGVFYEFVSMNDYGKKSPAVIGLQDVQIGIDYAVLISTNAGLWRYDLGDTVCFTSLDPYRIKISGRTKHFINVFGEELMVGNSDEAIAMTCQEMNAEIAHYTAGPIFMNQQGYGGHEWVIEFNQEPQDLSLFAESLDHNLQKINSDYAAKRRGDIALKTLVLHKAPEGTFLSWMAQRGKLGGQHKVPRLSNKRTYIEELLSFFHVKNTS